MKNHMKAGPVNLVAEQTLYAARELLGWHKEVAGSRWLFQSGSEAAPYTWSPFTNDDDAWQLFTLWPAVKQLHKASGGIAVVVQVPTGDLVTFGAGSGRYCGPALCQAMAAAVGDFRKADKAYKLIEQKRKLRSQRYEDKL